VPAAHRVGRPAPEPSRAAPVPARAPCSHYYARQYTQALAREHDIALIHVANGFENYFTNFATESATTLAVRDMTQHRDLAGAYFAPVQAFDAYYESLSVADRDRLVQEVDQWIKQHRVQRSTDVGGAARLAFLAAERRAGKKIVAVLGKVLFDLEMPRGDGPATRTCANGSTIPWRSRPGIRISILSSSHIRTRSARRSPSTPSEMLKHWMPATVPANVHFLGTTS